MLVNIKALHTRFQIGGSERGSSVEATQMPFFPSMNVQTHWYWLIGKAHSCLGRISRLASSFTSNLETKINMTIKTPTDLFYCLGVFIVILLKCISYKRKNNILLIRAPIQM